MSRRSGAFLQRYMKPVADFNLHEKVCLGEGCFGKVYKTTMKSKNPEGIPVAIKFFINGDEILDSTEKQKDFLKEIEVLIKMDHPAILRIRAFNIVPEPFIATDYKKTDLQKILNLDSSGKLSEIGLPDDFWNNTRRSICIYGIVSGLKCIHSKNIRHRDLKPGNILIDDDGYPYIADFGLAKSMSVESTEGRGTPIYMAPETFENLMYSTKVDIYSLAIILYEIVTKCPAYPPNITLYKLSQLVINGERPKFPEKYEYPEILNELINKCWEQDPNIRADINYIYDFLNTQNWYFPGTDMDAFNKYKTEVLHETVK
ncbi:Serine/threonine-protein kinase Nek7 [Tritrichomonas foetus]|uniref:Serine/threonine-protein kinase Nek7 n=1 Tax=Tritrichomonas foetus TaxID=1144522 RepID=A0A1J4K3R6_9EUKA|nr:Serine/threonine-protein kinase Nek7 [Tritrichomonas foetus]|eukprot:OHT04125.1 Serine/threonine-protein kinase Nek7 [Tritrichomonas foetus]